MAKTKNTTAPTSPKHEPKSERCPGPCLTCDNRPPANKDEKKQLEIKAGDLMEMAATNLFINQPFFGTLSSMMHRIPDWEMTTAGVDGVHLFYNPKFVCSLPYNELIGVMCHEILHLAYGHIYRCGTRQRGKWNAAIDFATNRDIRNDIRLELPSWVLFNEKFNDMTAEEIYEVLPDSPNWDSMDEHLPPAISQTEMEGRVIQAAAAASNSKGSLPVGLKRYLDKLRDPRTKWNHFIYATAVDRFNRVDYNCEVRAHSSYGVARALGIRSTWIPGLAHEEAGDFVIVSDTSGSVDQRLLTVFASEMQGLIQMARRSFIIAADADVQEVMEVTKWDEIFQEFGFKGGGGTDFRPAFEHIQTLGIKPALVVYFTDGYGTFPDSPPDYPVVWAFTKNHSPAPWGDSVVVECDDD